MEDFVKNFNVEEFYKQDSVPAGDKNSSEVENEITYTLRNSEKNTRMFGIKFKIGEDVSAIIDTGCQLTLMKSYITQLSEKGISTS
jgi:hypothetical protein